MAETKPRTWLEISKSAVKNNYSAFRKLLSPKTKLLGVVKSNAYGHGLVSFAALLDKLGIDEIGVDSIVEGLTLRRNRIKSPILVMGFTLPENFAAAAREKIALTISTMDNVRLLAGKRLRLPIHIKIETGLNRQGFSLADVPKLIRLLQKARHIDVAGLYTHFAKAYYPRDKSFTEKQIEKFRSAAALFRAAGYRPMLHAAATGGAINFPQTHFDMVRVGIGLYGLWPTEETRRTYEKKIHLSPALSWKTQISEIKNASAGETVGYYRTERLRRDSRLAVLPIGYWHGFDRRLSSIGHVLVRGKKAKVMGRVSMDMTVIDVTDISAARAGGEVVLIGKDHANQITAEDLAAACRTINYEIVTRINPLKQKFYL